MKKTEPESRGALEKLDGFEISWTVQIEEWVERPKGLHNIKNKRTDRFYALR